jgi:hypothetical protein
MLLTRTQFRNAVFARDKDRCVFCELPAVDAHHIIERRLFDDGGYYLNNGISVCETHHLDCERTIISVEDARRAAGIQKKVIPSHFYDDVVYDKWGNVCLENGKRAPGELFRDESVQKILKEHPEFASLFTQYFKYPRTHHLPWSPGATLDDRMLASVDDWQDKICVITEKMDGENTTLYNDHIHARSISSEDHISRHWVKNFWNRFKYDIPDGMRICGENVYAKHSIKYTELDSYFLGFSVWQNDICLGWSETKLWFGLFGITPVPELYAGYFRKEDWNTYVPDTEKSEGYVIRPYHHFYLSDFKTKVGKYVRAQHVQTNQHWKNRKIEENILK